MHREIEEVIEILEKAISPKIKHQEAWPYVHQALTKLRQIKPEQTDFTKKWRVKHGEPMTYNERIINSACDLIDRLTAEKNKPIRGSTEFSSLLREYADIETDRGLIPAPTLREIANHIDQQAERIKELENAG